MPGLLIKAGQTRGARPAWYPLVCKFSERRRVALQRLPLGAASTQSRRRCA